MAAGGVARHRSARDRHWLARPFGRRRLRRACEQRRGVVPRPERTSLHRRDAAHPHAPASDDARRGRLLLQRRGHRGRWERAYGAGVTRSPPEEPWFNPIAEFLGPAYLRNAFTT